MGRKFIDLTGFRHPDGGRLTALEIAGKNRFNQTIWRCRCDCGEIRNVLAGNLVSGKIKSCGMCTKETLCLSCYHATNPENVCPWCGLDQYANIRFEPVPGWEAEEKYIKIRNGNKEVVRVEKSYKVYKCPLYKKV